MSVGSFDDCPLVLAVPRPSGTTLYLHRWYPHPLSCTHPCWPRPLSPQSAILKFVHKHADMLAPIAALPVTEFMGGRPTPVSLGGSAGPSPVGVEGAAGSSPALGGQHIVVVEATASAGNALHTLVSNMIWGVPVVGGDGAIVANFSVSDVRHLASFTNQADADAALALPVLEFLRAGRASTLHTTASPSLAPVVVCAGDTVSMAIQLLAESHLHHIYIVDAARVPQGVLSLTDVMAALVYTLQ